jgi:hypothetical protein
LVLGPHAVILVSFDCLPDGGDGVGIGAGFLCILDSLIIAPAASRPKLRGRDQFPFRASASDSV